MTSAEALKRLMTAVERIKTGGYGTWECGCPAQEIAVAALRAVAQAEPDKEWKDLVAHYEAERADAEIARAALAERTYERDSLRLEIEGWKQKNRQDNEYLIGERDALKAALASAREGLKQADEWLNTSIPGDMYYGWRKLPAVQAALKKEKDGPTHP